MDAGDSEAFIPPGTVLLARADSNTGVVVPTLEGVRDTVTVEFAEDRPGLGAQILDELVGFENSRNEDHAAEASKNWVGRTLRAALGWNDPNSPEKDVPGFLDRLSAQQREALILVGDYAMYCSRRCVVLEQEPRPVGREVLIPFEYEAYPPALNQYNYSSTCITGSKHGLEDVLPELRCRCGFPQLQKGAPGILECAVAGGLLWEKAT